MKSNYHTVRSAGINRGTDRATQKLGGAKRHSWAYNAKRERTNTGRVTIIRSAQEDREVLRTPASGFLLTKSVAPLKRD